MIEINLGSSQIYEEYEYYCSNLQTQLNNGCNIPLI